MIEIAGLVAIVFGLSVLLTWYLSRPGVLGYFQDIPNHRSSHECVISRGGGIAIVISSMAGLGWVLGGWAGISIELLLGAGLLITASLFDDRGHVDWRVRALIHLVAANLLVLSQAEVIGSYGVLASVSVAIAVLWFINLYNFMDGSDGLAGLMALVGCAVIAFLGSVSGHAGIFSAALVISSAVAGFLVFNLPPARIFMGDTGSTFLGFSLAWLVLWGIREEVIHVVTAAILFAPFWVDASVTLGERLYHREKVWEAHKRHYFQRLIAAGLSHRQVLLAEVVLMLICALFALIFQFSAEHSVKLGIIGMWVALMITAIFWVRCVKERIR